MLRGRGFAALQRRVWHAPVVAADSAVIAAITSTKNIAKPEEAAT